MQWLWYLFCWSWMQLPCEVVGFNPVVFIEDKSSPKQSLDKTRSNKTKLCVFVFPLNTKNEFLPRMLTKAIIIILESLRSYPSCELPADDDATQTKRDQLTPWRCGKNVSRTVLKKTESCCPQSCCFCMLPVSLLYGIQWHSLFKGNTNKQLLSCFV